MKRHLWAAVVPPLAVCRYGCARCCAIPIGGFWIGGIALLAYHFIHAPHINPLLGTGSLVAGVALVAVAMTWAQLTIAQVRRFGCKESEPSPTLCRVLPSADETDPLEEVRRAREV